MILSDLRARVSELGTMGRRYLIASVFVLLINKVVSLEQTVEAVDGGSVILPCSYSGEVPKSEELNIFWRYNDDKKVYNIVKGEFVEDQDASYKSRTESFPDAYQKGNFSIKLSKVRVSDQGMYSCFMHFAQTTLKVQLQVKAPQPTTKPTTQPTTKPTPQPITEAENKSMESRSVKNLLIFSVLLGYSLILL